MKRTLANLSTHPLSVIEGIRRGLGGEELIGAHQALTITESRTHSYVAAVLGTAEKLGLAGLVDAQKSRQRDLVTAMIAGRGGALRPDLDLCGRGAWLFTTRTVTPDDIALGSPGRRRTGYALLRRYNDDTTRRARPRTASTLRDVPPNSYAAARALIVRPRTASSLRDIRSKRYSTVTASAISSVDMGMAIHSTESRSKPPPLNDSGSAAASTVRDCPGTNSEIWLGDEVGVGVVARAFAVGAGSDGVRAAAESPGVGVKLGPRRNRRSHDSILGARLGRRRRRNGGCRDRRRRCRNLDGRRRGCRRGARHQGREPRRGWRW